MATPWLTAMSNASTRRRRALACFALVAFAAGAAPARAEPTTLTAAIIGISVSIWPAIVADRKGFFAEEGPQARLRQLGCQHPFAAAAVAAGSTAIGSSSMVDTIRGIGGGAGEDVPQQPRGRYPQPGGGQEHQVGRRPAQQEGDDRRRRRRHQPVVGARSPTALRARSRQGRRPSCSPAPPRRGSPRSRPARSTRACCRPRRASRRSRMASRIWARSRRISASSR